MVLPVPSTYESHLKAGYLAPEGEETSGTPYYVSSGDAKREVQRPLFEAIDCAKKIQQQYGKSPIWLSLSGGIDSECMAQAFIYAKVPFKVAIARFPYRLNEFDIQHAIRFCHIHQLQFQVFDFDIIDFYSQNLHLEYAKKYRCNSPQLTAHMHFFTMIPGTVISPWCPPEVRFRDSGEPTVSMPTERYLAFDRFFQQQPHKGVYFFFLYTPEIIKSFLQLNCYKSALSQNCILHPNDTENFYYQLKCEALRESGFVFTPRKYKQTGFEKIKTYYAKLHGRLDDPVYEELFRYPLQELIPDPVEVIAGFPPDFFQPQGT